MNKCKKKWLAIKPVISDVKYLCPIFSSFCLLGKKLEPNLNQIQTTYLSNPRKGNEIDLTVE